MNTKFSRQLLVSTVALGTIFGLAACSSTTTEPESKAEAKSEVAATGTPQADQGAVTTISDASIVAHFDLKGGELPENIVAAADGGVVVTFAASRQVVHLSPQGDKTVIATLPTSADEAATTPVLGFALVTGLVRDGDTYYTLLATGAEDTTGVWKIEDGAQPERIASLPSTGLPNGLALDAATQTLFVADSVTGSIFSVPTAGGDPEVWSSDPALRTTGFLGVNGIKLRGGNLYASNLDLGTLLSIPVQPDGAAGEVEVVASDLVGIDDFDFTGNGDEVVATIDPDSEVVLVQADGTHATVLSASDGLSNPTSALVSAGKLYIPSAAYVTQEDPNLLVATIATN